MKTVWVDLLCRSSVLKIIFLSRRISVEKIYYVNAVRYFSPFFVRTLEILTRSPVIQAKWIAEGVKETKDISLYELIHLRLGDILEKWLSEADISGRVRRYCQRYGYDPIKVKEHLKTMAYPHVYKLVEISVLAGKTSGKDSLYVFRNGALSKIAESFLDKKDIFFYSTHISHWLPIQNRADYHYDPLLNNNYFSGRLKCIGRTWALYLFSLVNVILCLVFAKRINRGDHPYIGIELIQGRVRLNEINDLYWLKDSRLQRDTVWGLEHEEYDEESKETINSLGIRRCKVLRHHRHWFLMKDSGRSYVTVSIRDWLRTLPHMLWMSLSLFFWNENGWLRWQEGEYTRAMLFWESVYRQLGIRILWSMYDKDLDKLPKMQALEELDGLYMGSHWSNFPIEDLYSRKCYDIFFTWGPHFRRNIFKYPSLEAFDTGYPLDYYFESKKEDALRLRNKYPGKFILSYHDSAMGNDTPNTKRAQLQIYGVFISMIENNDNLIIFLKPKRKFVLDEILREIPLQHYIDEGRIEVFVGETARSKAVPAMVGMASDLVVGLGISTAAAECYFAGTVSFHADLTGFERNEFGNKGLNKIMFRDIESLKKVIEYRIEGKKALSHNDYREYYEALDPFQDGKAYIRTGFVIRKMQEFFQLGFSREGVIEKARREYNVFLATTYQKAEDGINMFNKRGSLHEVEG